MKNNEEWKDVKGYEGIYLVSNFGRVMSLFREVWGGKGFYKIKTRLIKPAANEKGYKIVTLSKNGKHRTFKVHRLVASAFINNSENKPQVNHIDGNKLNNNSDNLEWCTNSENQLHSIRLGLRKSTVIDTDLLFDMFINQNMTSREIAEKLDTTMDTVRGKLATNKIRKKDYV